MDRVLTQSEKIKRAEEIYAKRQQEGTKKRMATIPVSNKKDLKLFKKMTIQILICLCIYFAVFIIKNNSYFFSDNFVGKANEILNYNINFEEIYSKINTYLSDNTKKEETNPDIVSNDGLSENTVEVNANAVTTNLLEETLSVSEINYEYDESSISQIREDANAINATSISFIQPAYGTITSKFGVRMPTTDSVPKFHTGIDIAANKGTKIVASMEGKVTLVSSYGDFGKHLKITNGDVVTLYAHCEKILVKEGDTIKQGQKIAEIGSTGNSTGSHLHFEIQRVNVPVNPEYILEIK